MKKLLQFDIKDTEKHKTDISKLITEVIEYYGKEFLFNGLSNPEIKDEYYDEKIYQLDKYQINTISDIKLSKQDDYYNIILSIKGSEKEFIVGSVPLALTFKIDKFLETSDIKCEILMTGGKYKKVIVNDDGAENVKTFREPILFRLSIYERPIIPEGYSQIGFEDIYDKNIDYFCPKCKTKLSGERNCLNCGLKIFYPGEQRSKTTSEKIIETSDKISNVGETVTKSGNSMIWGCTIPIIIIILILLFI
ncbi:MAG: hypothetical protein ABF991_12600 [Liquorilactobacillus hordei]|uniref:hypothetical protein n=1 Tax=Liquorilactobacillus hordei TaxID=468911 RepID=UPI0039E7F678